MIVSPCNAAKMSAKRMRSALVAGSALLCLLSAGQLWAFNLDDVSAKAKELAGQKVPDKQADEIRQRHNELLAQLRLQTAFEQQRRALEVEIAESLARYRELKGIAAPAAAATAPAASSEPAKG